MTDSLIVVGAGSAGAVIAARVTEDPRKSVTLIEAGPDYADRASVPGDLLDGRKNSIRDHDWGFKLLPTSEQLPSPLPRGKVVGGSSAVNTCIALRGERDDYDEWARLGCTEWSWDRCLPAFRRLEDDRDISNDAHGRGGPIFIHRATPSELVPFQTAFLRAVERFGFPACADHNAPDSTGFGPHPMNKDGNVRVSTARGYLESARTRSNLAIRPRTLVRRVVIEARRVTGVEIDVDGRVVTLPCRKLVLSAGAIQTPGILVRSGIGPRRTLEAIGVPLIVDAPVGERLLDHPGSLIALVARPGVFFSDKPPFIHPPGTPRTNDGFPEMPMIQTTLRYTATGSDDVNDMQLQPITFLQLNHGMPLMMGIASVLEKPRGHGKLVVDSADPLAKPKILPEFLADPWDRARVVEGLLLARRVAESDEIRALSHGIIWPSPAELMSAATLDAWVRAACGSGYHPCGTTPMGADGDPRAVVDQYGRVLGVEGLFVADAGIMPTIPRANTNLPTIMIGERFGEWFRDGVV